MARDYINGEMDSFTIDSESKLKSVDFNPQDYEIHEIVINQFNQEVCLYVPNDEYKSVIAGINGRFVRTGFYDCSDMYKDSDYLPVLYNGSVYCYFSYYYASEEHYYPKRYK